MDAPLSREERLREYFDRLGAQPASKTADEALQRIIRTLDEIEDAYSGIPKREPPPRLGESDGRMYPPLRDRIMLSPNGSIVAQTKGHDILIARDGSITIRNRGSGDIEFHQVGKGK